MHVGPVHRQALSLLAIRVPHKLRSMAAVRELLSKEASLSPATGQLGMVLRGGETPHSFAAQSRSSNLLAQSISLLWGPPSVARPAAPFLGASMGALPSLPTLKRQQHTLLQPRMPERLSAHSQVQQHISSELLVETEAQVWSRNGGPWLPPPSREQRRAALEKMLPKEGGRQRDGGTKREAGPNAEGATRREALGGFVKQEEAQLANGVPQQWDAGRGPPSEQRRCGLPGHPASTEGGALEQGQAPGPLPPAQSAGGLIAAECEKTQPPLSNGPWEETLGGPPLGSGGEAEARRASGGRRQAAGRDTGGVQQEGGGRAAAAPGRKAAAKGLPPMKRKYKRKANLAGEAEVTAQGGAAAPPAEGRAGERPGHDVAIGERPAHDMVAGERNAQDMVVGERNAEDVVAEVRDSCDVVAGERAAQDSAAKERLAEQLGAEVPPAPALLVAAQCEVCRMKKRRRPKGLRYAAEEEMASREAQLQQCTCASKEAGRRSATERSPAQSSAPVQSGAPAQSSVPAQSSAHIQSNVPAQSSVPLQCGAPAQSSAPAQGSAHMQSSATTQSSAHIQSNVPAQSIVPSQSSAPAQISVRVPRNVAAPRSVPKRSSIPAVAQGEGAAHGGHTMSGTGQQAPAMLPASEGGYEQKGAGMTPTERLAGVVEAIEEVNAGKPPAQTTVEAQPLGQSADPRTGAFVHLPAGVGSVSHGAQGVDPAWRGDAQKVLGVRSPSKPRLRASLNSALSTETASSSTIAAGAGEAAEGQAAVAGPGLAARLEAVLVVEDAGEAGRVAELARTVHRQRVFACDTEVMGIDVKKESPVGHGSMTCFTFYAGPDVDWGHGCSRVFVDLLGGGEQLLAPFKAFFEDAAIKKVWHNYSFDRHILGNHGVDARGLYADTMHMARLHDSARDKKAGAGYSLESLTADAAIMGSGQQVEAKIGLATLFGKPNIKKDGAEGKLRVLPPIEELQTAPDTRDAFIQYAAYDATATWQLWAALKSKLEGTAWRGLDASMRGTMWDCYVRYYQPFGELLTDMERAGMLVDTAHLAAMEKVALLEQARAGDRFRRWAAKRCPDARLMNVGSDLQIRQLLFGGKPNCKDKDQSLPPSRVFKVPNTTGYVEPGREGKPPKKQRDIVLTGLGADLPVEVWTPSGWPACSGAVLKGLAGKVAIDWATPEVDEDGDGPAEPPDSDAEDAPPVADDVSQYGSAYAAFGGGVAGKAACHAIAALVEVSAISTLLSGFIQPLQGDQMLGPDHRVHCSLNINTETGRLSARRPNLQNQPALEKDRYKIRQAFVAAPGNTLIVADYGQLELRLLAHLAGCESMLDAFRAGGDFHSRTAVNMYAHVREAVERGEVLLEWDSKDGTAPAPAPMLKDVFGAERRKAKMLNFSIAYGKTAAGLSKDWKVSLEEAQATVDLWYAARKEVKLWQQARQEEARKTGHVRTLLGRRRRLPEINDRSRLKRSHMERAAINTPVQGSAADVAMLAMLELSRDARLAELGWRLLLQVHDEMILEGPEESAEEALARVVHAMAHPFDGKNILQVDLAVDAKYAKNWYAAK